MQQNISTQIQLLQKQMIDSLTPQSGHSQNTNIQSATENQQNLPKMQQIMKIFINSLKLNEKLYNSIVQKQTKINSGANSFLIISAQTDSKIQDALKRTKQLYEDTVHQNQKARFMLEQFIAPIRQQLKSKVDQTTFTLQMKMLLDEYDVMGHQISYDATEEQSVKEQKRKSVNSQTLNFLRDKILPVLSHIEQRLEATIENGIVMSGRIEELNVKASELDQRVNGHQEFIDRMEMRSLNYESNKANEQQADKKIKQCVRFVMKEYSSQMQATIEKMSRSIKNLESSLNNQIETIKTSLSASMANNKASETLFKSRMDILEQKSVQHSDLLHQQSLQSSLLQTKLTSFDQKVSHFAEISKTVETINKKLQNGQFQSKTLLQGSDFQNLIQKLNTFDLDSKKIKLFLKDSEQRNITLKGELQCIRDILSKKANFSDILLHVQNKVDKREFQDLKSRLFQDQKDTKSDIKNHSMLVSKQSQTNRSWKKRHIKSRSFFTPSPAQKPTQFQSEPQQVKRFKLGFNHEFLLSNDMLKKQISKTQYLRKSIANNNSNIQNHNTQT